MKTVEITLDHPVQLADRELTSVTMRRPTLEDALSNPIRDDFDMKGEATLLATLCGLKLEEAKKLDLADYRKIQNQLVRFRNNTERD